MKRKPNSYSDFIKTVICVEHPKLKPQHRLFLISIATHANAKTGRGSYPGREFLEKASARKWKRVDAYADHCEALGLIKRVVADAHRGKRIEWDFCLDNPAYPDLYPGFSTDFGGQEGDHLKPGSGGHFQEERWSLLPPKVVTSVKKGGQEGDHPSTTTTTPPSTPPPTGGEGGVVVKPSGHGRDVTISVKETFAEMNKIYLASEDKILAVRKQDMADLHKLVADRPCEEILAAFTYAHDNGILHGWKFPLIPFFRGYDALVEAAKRKSKRKLISTEDVQRSAEVSLQQHNALWSGKSKDEPGPEEF
ncbi:MAG TPA: hypothetical protein VN025_05950 [Candidatus Dormibacteraeota bacterium]|jgi:hypothetical protein|nr:hypothetical protein [Candidatus Dormibacteraeota bacterium]